jgi:hypothetical protein
MGVQGLWALAETCGKPVPLDTLENKVLAVGKSRIASMPIHMYLLRFTQLLNFRALQTCLFG